MARSVAEIQADLDAAYAARRAALNGSYSLDTGQGKQSVTRPPLKDLQTAIDNLQDELDAATAFNGLSITVNR